MKKNEYRKIACVISSFGLLGLILVLNFAIRKRVFYIHHYYLNMLLLPFFAGSGLLVSVISKRIKYNKTNAVISCMVLVLIDQLIKIYLMYVDNIKYPLFLISNWLYIEPQFNPWGSYIGDLLQTKVPLLGLFELISLPVIYVFYKYCSKKIIINKTWLQLWFNLCLSGEICSTIDTFVFGSSYDFITLNGMLKFDIKDYYLEISKGCLIIVIIDWLAHRIQKHKNLK
jgi:hypothetical protein